MTATTWELAPHPDMVTAHRWYCIRHCEWPWETCPVIGMPAKGVRPTERIERTTA